MICAKFGWNWSFGSSDILKFCQCIFVFCYHFPLEKHITLHLDKLKFPSPRDVLCQVWLKRAHWFLRRRFSFKVNVVSLFRYYLPFENGWILQLNKLESSPPTDAFCQVCLKLVHLLWRRWKMWKCEKFTDRQTDGRTYNRRSE